MITRDELADFLDEIPKRPYPHASMQPSPGEMKHFAEDISEGKR